MDMIEPGPKLPPHGMRLSPSTLSDPAIIEVQVAANLCQPNGPEQILLRRAWPSFISDQYVITEPKPWGVIWDAACFNPELIFRPSEL